MDNGNYKLSWRQRIGYSSGDLAQNLIYQTVSIWLLFFYTNVYGLKPTVAAVMFLVVRIIDVIWDPVVGAFVDKSNPRWGKYRSWLVMGGLPLAGFAMLCFWNGFSGSLLYAYITYVGLSMFFTLINVPYGALGGVIPGLVLAWVGFNSSSQAQTPLAEQGILWLVTLIPALLFLLAIYVIGKYELSDKVMDDINASITNRQ